MDGRMAKVEVRAVKDDWDDVAARIANPDEGRTLFEFRGPFGDAAFCSNLARGVVSVEGDRVAPLTLAARMWPPSMPELVSGLSGTADRASVSIRVELRSWRPSRRSVEVSIDGTVTHRLQKVAWRDELRFTSTFDDEVLGTSLPLAVASDASPLATSLLLLLSTIDLLDRLAFARGFFRYV